MCDQSTAAAVAAQAGLAFHDLGEGFFSIEGPAIRVRCYPDARSCFLEGHQDPWREGGLLDAILLASTVPDPVLRKCERLTGKAAQELRRRTVERYLETNGVVRCYWCRVRQVHESLSLDHLIPIYRGGTNEDVNLVPACRDCNSRRGSDMAETAPVQSAARNALYARKAMAIRKDREVHVQAERRESLRRAISAAVWEIRVTRTSDFAGVQGLDPRTVAGLHTKAVAGTAPNPDVTISDAPDLVEPRPTRPSRPLPVAVGGA